MVAALSLATLLVSQPGRAADGPAATAAVTPAVTPLLPSPAAIDRLANAYIMAWNAHDAHAFAQTYTPDADLTNVFGKSAHGRDGIEKLVGAAFSSFFGKSVQARDETTIRFLTPTIASVDIRWSMTGATVPGWPAVQHGLQSWIIMQQSDGSWLIAVLHNMTLP